MRSNGFRQVPKKPSAIPEGGAGVVAVIVSAGLCYQFQRWSQRDEQSATGHTVYVYRRGNSCLRKCLGSLAELATLSDVALKAKIAEKFPLKSPPVAKE